MLRPPAALVHWARSGQPVQAGPNWAAPDPSLLRRIGAVFPFGQVTVSVSRSTLKASTRVLGMSPTHFRSGGVQEVLTFAVGQCSLGAILVASSEKGVAAILLGDDPQMLVRELEDRFPRARLIGGDAAFERLVAQVVGLVEAPAHGLALPLDVRGTAFQQRVWLALREIPAGKTETYSSIAEKIGSPRSVRAVAGACAANVHAVAIPCHRVVRDDGALSGYRWGVERKRELLDREHREEERAA